MRADMGKVLVERPRLSGWITPGPRKGHRKAVRKLLDAGDAPPGREGMKRPYFNRKSFNEHLGPLRRFLDSNVGRPWDKVYAEICAHVDRGNVVQKHILTHLFDYVVTNVILIDGAPCDGAPGYRYGDPLRESDRRHQWYVCPKSGLLRRTRHVPQDYRRPKPPPPRRVPLTEARMCLELNGQWELVTVAPLPVPEYRGSRYDVVRKRAVYASSAEEARELYGADVYAVDRRPLSRRELRSLPVPIDWVR